MENIEKGVKEILRGYIEDHGIIDEGLIDSVACDVGTRFRAQIKDEIEDELRLNTAISMIEVILNSRGGTSKGWIEPTVREAFKCADEIINIARK